MSACFTRFAFAATACALAAPASAQTVARKDLSVDAAVIIATTAMADCKAKGWPVSVAVVGRNGEVLVHLRGDGTGPHTMDNSYRRHSPRAPSASPSGEMEKRLKDDPQLGARHASQLVAAQGALPIKIGDDTIGAAGASGAPGGEKDEACVQTGLDKVKDQLK